MSELVKSIQIKMRNCIIKTTHVYKNNKRTEINMYLETRKLKLFIFNLVDNVSFFNLNLCCSKWVYLNIYIPFFITVVPSSHRVLSLIN